MPSLRNHTHCQVAQKADTQTKTCQRVWLPQHTDRLRRKKHENTTLYKNIWWKVLILRSVLLMKIVAV